jgi:hypothetical protein
MIVDVEQKKERGGFAISDQEIVLIGDTEGSLSIKEYVEMIAMMIRKLDVVDPARFYPRGWEKEGASR